MQNLIPKEEEERRLKALAEYRILGTKPESCYDDITKIAASTCDVPISLMTLVDKDKQWFNIGKFFTDSKSEIHTLLPLKKELENWPEPFPEAYSQHQENTLLDNINKS